MIDRVQRALRFSMQAPRACAVGGDVPGATIFNGTSTAGHATIANCGRFFYGDYGG